MTWALPRRFWDEAIVRPDGDGFRVELDDRPLRAPSRQLLRLPTEALARTIAAEWNAIEDEIRPDRLPFTRAANTALDRVAADPGPVIDAIAAYGANDLLCYRAEEPAALVVRQVEAWEPWLAWCRGSLGAPLLVVAGVIHHPQPPDSLARLRVLVAGHDSFALTALHDLVTLSGSLVLGLAVALRALDPEEAWRLSRIDETWQAEQWGDDSEATATADRRRTDFLRAARLLDLLSPQAVD